MYFSFISLLGITIATLHPIDKLRFAIIILSVSKPPGFDWKLFFLCQNITIRADATGNDFHLSSA